jgi:hypothetical protein
MVSVFQAMFEAFALDQENGNTYWANAIALEMNVLKKMGCFKIPPSKWNPKTEGFQYASLWIVFDVKSCLKQKAHLVCGGHIIQCNLNMYASTIKMLSICLLHVIAIANKLEILVVMLGMLLSMPT